MNKSTTSKIVRDAYRTPCVDVIVFESRCPILAGSNGYGESGFAGQSGEETEYGNL